MNASFTVSNGCLSIGRELRLEYDTAFDSACDQLLQCPERVLVIDLGQAQSIGSLYIGMIAALYFQACSKGKLLKVVATPPVIKLLINAGFSRQITLEGKIALPCG